jgi:hypothetical protein
LRNCIFVEEGVVVERNSRYSFIGGAMPIMGQEKPTPPSSC